MPIVISENPFDTLPRVCCAIAEQLSVIPSNYRDCERALKDAMSLVPAEEKTPHLRENARQILLAACWKKGMRLLAYSAELQQVYVGNVGQNDVYVFAGNLPRRKVVARCDPDPYDWPNRFGRAASQRYLLEAEWTRNVAAWGMRCVKAFLGGGHHVTFVYRTVIPMMSEDKRVHIRDGVSSRDVAGLQEWLDTSHITQLVMTWGAFRRLRKYGLLPRPGFFPIEVVEEAGRPERIIALVPGRNTVYLRPMTWEEYASSIASH